MKLAHANSADIYINAKIMFGRMHICNIELNHLKSLLMAMLILEINYETLHRPGID